MFIRAGKKESMVSRECENHSHCMGTTLVNIFTLVLQPTQLLEFN